MGKNNILKMEVLISDQKKVENLKNKIREEGIKNLHVLSDFDRTLTYGENEGRRTPSLISELRNGNYLSKEYAEKAHALYDKYHPIEKDPSIPLKEKKEKMQEWWEKHDKLLVDSGLSKDDFKDIIENGKAKLREGVSNFLDFLHEKNIPLVIFSSSGAGNAIPMFFKKINKDYSNIYYVVNKFNWNKEGRAISVKKPIIHVMNKDETGLKQFSEIYKKIKERRNVILLGDSLGDLGMIKGFDCKNVIKIGFLNLNYNQNLEEYKENFDIVLKEDGEFNYITELMKSLKK